MKKRIQMNDQLLQYPNPRRRIRRERPKMVKPVQTFTDLFAKYGGKELEKTCNEIAAILKVAGS